MDVGERPPCGSVAIDLQRGELLFCVKLGKLSLEFDDLCMQVVASLELHGELCLVDFEPLVQLIGGNEQHAHNGNCQNRPTKKEVLSGWVGLLTSALASSNGRRDISMLSLSKTNFCFSS